VGESWRRKYQPPAAKRINGIEMAKMTATLVKQRRYQN